MRSSFFPAPSPLLAVTLVLLALPGEQAFSQGSGTVLEEVIVTAQKREQALQDVPLAVTALTAKDMREAGIGNIQQLSRLVPTLQVQTGLSSLDSNYRIRRVGNIGNIPTFEPAVATFQDGAFRSRPVFTGGDIFDLERVEVLRGPQSTLYGKNTTGGVVAFYTQAPAPTFEGNARLDVGQLEGASDAPLARFVGGVSGPVTGTLGASLGVSASYQDHSFDSALSETRDHANNLDRQAVRGQLAWEPAEDLTLRLIAGYAQEDDDTTLPDLHFVPGSSAAAVRDILQAGGDAEFCASNDPFDQRHCSRAPQTTDLRASETTLLADYQLAAGWTLSSVSSWDWFRFRATQDDVLQLASPLLKFRDTQESESWQQELRLTSAGGETIDWLAGLYYYRNRYDRGDHGKTPGYLYDTLSDAPLPSLLVQQLFGTPFPVPIALPGQDGVYAGKQDTDYWAVFGQATWNLTPEFSITAGVRWQEEDKNAAVSQEPTLPGLSLLSVALVPASIGGKLDRSTHETTWSVTPQYFITADTNVYATVAHGFKSGGFNINPGTTAMDQRQFQDEDIMHYETGLKSEQFGGKLRFSLSAFFTDFKNYQDAAFIGQEFTVGNAQKTELKGAEIDGSAVLGGGFTTNFGVSYANLEYKKNTSGLCYPGRTPDYPQTGTCNLGGEHPVNAPEWVTYLGLMYDTPVSWGEAYARVDWSFSSDYNTSFSADPNKIQGSYYWVDARVGTRMENYELTAWVSNALDENVANFEALLTLFPDDPSYQTFRQSPRSYGLTLQVDF